MSCKPSTTSSLRDVADLGNAVRRLVPFPRCGCHGEPVVMRSDLNLASSEVHHWLVDAAVSVRQLEGVEAERPAEELIAEADAEVWDTAAARPGEAQPADRPPPGRRGRWRRNTVGVQPDDLVNVIVDGTT